MNRLLPFTALLAATGPMTAAEAPRGPRDPMQPPAVARVGSPVTADAPAPVNLTARHLLVVDGRRYVLDGNRRRTVGDTLGDARIERIEDAAVVVRNAAGTQRLPLFGGVVKLAAPEPTSTPSDRPAGRPTSSPGAQP